ncbi:polyphosphate--glucose phosphotransferase [Smaragdicoccus niigatensis]|uniref:polyphosphate--glucose phosphotransferase n=1 Tax=Smaragdicoccus niigatensis TaxID=359359 RepID=UPI000379C9BE|nr:ROK family protein [Smaragdicoccus niigatensis]
MNERTRRAFGVDIGGSGVKGAPVDLTTGELLADVVTIPTPKPATPDAVAATVAQLVNDAGWDGPVGVTLPCVVAGGQAQSAANVDPAWIGTDARKLFSSVLDGRDVSVLNDADAAGLAEAHFGAGKGTSGFVLMLTFGTGIGSALLHNGALLPNSELGHLEIDGREAEHRAAASVKTREQLSFEDWAAEVDLVLKRIEALLWPDLFIAGGGISAEHEKWIPLLTARSPVVPAQLRNTAGIVGAAMAAATGVTP